MIEAESQVQLGRFAGLFALPDTVGGQLSADAPEPGYFADLQLDQLVDAVVIGREEYDLEPAFRLRLLDLSAIERRQSVFADLEDDRLRSAMQAFCDGLARCKRQFASASRIRHQQQSQRWRLNAIAAYVEVIEAVIAALDEAAPSSTGMRAWLEWLRQYRASRAFTAAATGSRTLLADLGALRYTLSISGDEIIASPFAGQDDLSADILAVFERFRSADVAPHRFDLRPGAEMNQLHQAVLNLVVRLFPDVFDRVAHFVDQHRVIGDTVIDLVERELQFALSWLDFIAPMRHAGLPFCVPDVRPARRLDVTDSFDVLLAHTLVAAGQRPITNDVALAGDELTLVVTGPNQGGKTTLARTVGQLYHLAAIGLPVPGRSVALHPPDSILTHFDRGDRAGDVRSRLEEEVTRVADLLTKAGARSVVILNEMFSSTTWADAREMSSDVLRTVLDAGAVCVCVTFIDELSRLHPRVVSLVTAIDERDVTRRTFKVARDRADGRAHAIALAAKYGLTQEQLRARIEGR
ncbi:MutS-related protein [Actinoplanes regularis]|uniref:MutS-related protein n=1 Tax=Actinoplanes regularis TaxID=52697 RepID=UPI0024A5080B|nr:hypothetical protein [Actinoplanes regularis]GLW33773.1 DNA mismatch repair protein MutS [Actinoplanes regularis]